MLKRLSFAVPILLIVCVSVLGQTDPLPAMFDRQITFKPEVQVPPEAAASGIGGKVRVAVIVDALGTVIEAEKATGPGAVCPSVTRADVVALRNSAIEAARNVKFAPLENGGPERARSWVDFEFRGAEVGNELVFAAANEPVDKPAAAMGDKPRDPNRFTVKGDPNFSSATAAPPDYTGPVSVSKEPPADKHTTVTGDRNFSPASAGTTSSPGGKSLSRGILNGKAQTLVKPAYPAAARAVRAAGAVSVQVLIDEGGSVFSAQAVSGHPLLRPASVIAACGAGFSPTYLDGTPVKVSGIITYNFVP